jgi:hypothetical protein
MKTKVKFWVAGLVMAAAGLILVRLVSGKFASQVIVQLIIYLAGAALALAGLVIIMFGIRKQG